MEVKAPVLTELVSAHSQLPFPVFGNQEAHTEAPGGNEVVVPGRTMFSGLTLSGSSLFPHVSRFSLPPLSSSPPPAPSPPPTSSSVGLPVLSLV